jgi:hypothetical protein
MKKKKNVLLKCGWAHLNPGTLAPAQMTSKLPPIFNKVTMEEMKKS